MNRLLRLFPLAALRRHALLLATLLFAVPLPALTEGNFTYEVSNGQATITDFPTDYSGALAIPSTLGGYPVTTIGTLAFSECSLLTSVTIPEGVTNIGLRAFYLCTSLTSVKIPDSVQLIMGWAFEECHSLASINLPNYLFGMGESVFYGCRSLTSVTIPSWVSYIDARTFYGCSSLTSVTIPERVTSIGDSAFAYCSSLTSVTIPEGVTSIGYDAFYGCTSLPTDENGIQYESQEKRVLIDVPYSLAGEFVIPSSVRFINSGAFYNCDELTSVTISEGVTTIGNNAFKDCSALTSVIIPSSVTSIGDQAFSGCTSLTSVTIPEGINDIGDYTFLCCSSLILVTIPERVTSIGEKAFEGCSSLTSVEIPEGVTSIGDQAFSGCTSLTSVEIPESVTSISGFAFEGCSSLTSVTIPESVTTIDSSAFAGCSSLVITVSSGNASYASLDGCLFNKDYSTLLAGPSVEGDYVIPSSVTSIGSSAFGYCSSLTSVTIPSSVTSIGSFAFYNCSSLTSVTIPSSVTSIGYYAFSACTSLTSATIPASVTTIGSCAFSGCSSLISVTIEEGVTSIDNWVFYECSSLTSVTFSGKPCEAYSASFPTGIRGYYSAKYAAEWEAVIVDGKWNGLVMTRLAAEEKPSVPGDEGATIEGSAEAGWVVKPSEGTKEVVVSIPEGVEAAKVTVEVPNTATSVTANGAAVKVVKVAGETRYDITEFLNMPAAVAGKVDLTQAEVKAEIAEAILDTSAEGGAVFNPAAEKPLTTAKTKPGLTYILLEGDTLDSFTEGARTVGNGEPWTPPLTKRGSSPFYRIRITK